jgi:hypothetical protein
LEEPLVFRLLLKARLGFLLGGFVIIFQYGPSDMKIWVGASSQAMAYRRGLERHMIDINLAGCFGLEKSMSALLDKDANIESKESIPRPRLCS